MPASTHLGAFEDQPEHALRSVMEVNFFGADGADPTRAAHSCAAGKVATIVMVSSLSGLLGLPGSSAYCASKFALEGAAEALRNEVGRFGVRVSLIEPGGFASAMSSKRVLAADYPADSPYGPMLRHLGACPAGGGRSDARGGTGAVDHRQSGAAIALCRGEAGRRGRRAPGHVGR